MPNALLERFVSEREDRVRTIDHVTRGALEAGRDLSDQDTSMITAARERITSLDSQIEILSHDSAMSDAARAALSRNDVSERSAGHQYASAGELLWDVLHLSDRDARARYERTHAIAEEQSHNRAAEHMGTTAANTVATAGGLGGLVVAPVVGPVISLAPQGMPFVSAIGATQAPNPLSFMRPRIVDPALFNGSGVGVQSKEKAELVSKHFDIAVDTLQLSTVGGYLNVSQQLIALIPNGLDIILNQLNLRLTYALDRAAVTEVEKSEAKVDLPADADAKAVLTALFEAAALVFTTTGQMPTWLAMGPKGWGMLGSIVDLANRPLFPFLGPVNAMGTSSLTSMPSGNTGGLAQVVTPAITDTKLIMGNNIALEFYLHRYPVLEAVEPSVLGRQVAVAASYNAYRPTTAEEVTGGSPVPAKHDGAVIIAP